MTISLLYSPVYFTVLLSVSAVLSPGLFHFFLSFLDLFIEFIKTALTIISKTVTFIFHNFFSSLARGR